MVQLFDVRPSLTNQSSDKLNNKLEINKSEEKRNGWIFLVDMAPRDRIPANQCLPKVLDPSMPDKFTLLCIHLAEPPFLQLSHLHIP